MAVPIASGTRLGPYEIVSRIGAGGMGEVWRARDTRLDRSVAIKILPGEFADDAQLRLRFEREARTISQLSHPNICTLFDVGENYLVMELLEGESLADRISRGPLPLSEVLKYGVQIAEALDRAHRAGVVHRDLKPGNVMITRSGAKLLDFGLAKASRPVIPDAATALLTEQKPLTQEGTILGTFQYMAPEQLEGAEADTRSDIFALGAVLYEMATGRRAFDGKTKTSLIVAIVSGQPQPIRIMQPLTPPMFEHLIEKCLSKDPDDRWQSAHDVAQELRWIAEGGSQTGVAAPIVARRRTRERLWIGLTALLALATAILGIALWRHPAPRTATIRSSIEAPSGHTFDFELDGAGALTLSPDGRYMTFSATDSANVQRLWLRPLDALEARPLEGTQDGSYPFWSPDGRSIAFFAEGKLKRIDLDGGPATTICDAPEARGGSWGTAGMIVFEPHWREPLYRVAVEGGKPEPVTKLDATKQETTHRYPWFLPDGRHFLFLAGTHLKDSKSDLNAIYVASLDSPERKLVTQARSNVIYAAGHLVFARDNYLMAQRFDPRKLALVGDPVKLAEDVQYVPGFFRSAFSVAENGTIAYHSGAEGGRSQLTWVDRAGKELGTLGEPDAFREASISPDGKRVAAMLGDPGDIWLYDIERGSRTRFTTDPLNEDSPVWSPDGRTILYSSDREIHADIYAQATDGSGGERLILSSPHMKYLSDWSRDGRYVAYDRAEMKDSEHSDIWILDMAGDHKTRRLIGNAAFNEWGAVFSPDSHWILFGSDESGRRELYVTSFPVPGAKQQISTAGAQGTGAWTTRGEILYLAADKTAMSVKIAPGGTLQFGTPQPMFKELRAHLGDITADGQRVLLGMRTETATAPVTLVTNGLTPPK